MTVRREFTPAESELIVALCRAGESWNAIRNCLHRQQKRIQAEWRRLASYEDLEARDASLTPRQRAGLLSGRREPTKAQYPKTDIFEGVRFSDVRTAEFGRAPRPEPSLHSGSSMGWVSA